MIIRAVKIENHTINRTLSLSCSLIVIRLQMATPTLSELAGTREEGREGREGFRRPMEEVPTGGGSSTYKPLAAFSVSLLTS